MKPWVADSLICPECLTTPVPLNLTINLEKSGDILTGELSCPDCKAKYPIQKGVAVVLPQKTRALISQRNGYNSPSMLSAYLWSHFGDLFNDHCATDAYETWSKHFQTNGEDALDIGCAVGRLSFELAKTHRHVIGIDTSISFIKKAREILLNKRLDFELIIEGHLTEPRSFDFDEEWSFEGVDFLVADALALPFRQRDFTTVAAVNILEKVPDPLMHLEEVNRVLRPKSSMFLFSDPFSWDASVSPPERWLGGNGNGRYCSRGIDTLRRFFAGEDGIFDPPLTITQGGDVSWKIRKTENLWEHITSQFLVGRRE